MDQNPSTYSRITNKELYCILPGSGHWGLYPFYCLNSYIYICYICYICDIWGVYVYYIFIHLCIIIIIIIIIYIYIW